MIKRRPSKAELECVLSYKLALVVTKDSERILIGSESGIRRRLSGEHAADVMYDETRPFGTLLLKSEPTPDVSWKSVLYDLREAQSVLHSVNPIDHYAKENVLTYEQQAQDILTQKFDSEDPVSQFVALRIWYGYWFLREKRQADHCELFLEAMENLIRPFLYPCRCIDDRSRVTASNSIFRHPKEIASCDGEQTICHLAETTDVDYIIVDKSLIPLEKYYIAQFVRWPKYLICCKQCGQFFFANSLKYELCSQDCRDQARKKVLAHRKDDEETASIDRMCLNASAHWYNRLKKIKESNEWGEEAIQKYEAEKDRFLKEKRNKRKAYKSGEISFAELRDWLLHQEVVAQTVLESLWLHKGDST